MTEGPGRSNAEVSKSLIWVTLPMLQPSIFTNANAVKMGNGDHKALVATAVAKLLITNEGPATPARPSSLSLFHS